MISFASIPNHDSNNLSLAQFERHYLDETIRKIIAEKHYSMEDTRQFATACLNRLKMQFPLQEHWEEKELWKEFRKIVHQQLFQLQKRMDKNFGLSETRFNQMLEALNKGDDTLFERIFLTHFKSCQVYLQRNHGASHEDSYDATMNAMVEFHERLLKGKITYGNLRFLFTRMAGQIYFKWIKKEKNKESIENFNLPESPQELDDESYKILNKAWEKLCDQCRNLLKDFYYSEIPLNQIAEQMKKSHAAVRKQKQRCVEKLRNLFVKNS